MITPFLLKINPATRYYLTHRDCSVWAARVYENWAVGALYSRYKVTIHLSNGKDFVIQAKNNSVENKYIRSMKLNGEDLAEPRFSHFDLMKGGELIFEMEN